MQKTRKSIAKRYKVTGTGKIIRRKPGKRHRNRFMTPSQRRAGRQDQGCGKGHEAVIKRGMPHA